MADVHCVLCLNTSGDLVPAPFEVGGYRVCEAHGKVEGWVWRPDNNQPDLPATVSKYRQARQMLGRALEAT
jgi:hypothetical protein